MFPKHCPTALLRFLSHKVRYSEKLNKMLVSTGCSDAVVDGEGGEEAAARGEEAAAPGMPNISVTVCNKYTLSS